jgi:hypothetical protein
MNNECRFAIGQEIIIPYKPGGNNNWANRKAIVKNISDNGYEHTQGRNPRFITLTDIETKLDLVFFETEL